MTGRTGLVIVDDHSAFREGLRQIIEEDSRFEIIGESCNGHQALELIRRTRPAVVILDISIPPPDGLEVARTLRLENIPTGIILLTMYREEGILASARRLNLGYVLKDSAMTDIVSAIEAAVRGERYTSPMLNHYIQDIPREAAAALPMGDYRKMVGGLLPAEQQILRLIGDYCTTRDIAEALKLQPAQVEELRAQLCRKLGIASGHALMKFALNNLHAHE